LGAEAARKQGKVYEQYDRLQQALAVAPAVDKDTGEDPKPSIQSSLDAIDQAYARVEIRGDARRRPVLTRPELPFAPDQRSAIEWAQKVVSETGSFKGMLPLGKYVVGEQDFEVAASKDWLVVDVGKVKHPEVATAPNPSGPQPPTAGGTQTQSAIRYASVV